MIFYENKTNSLYCWKNYDLNFPPHLHKELEIVVVEEGELEITVNGTPQVLHKGDLSLIFPNTIHSYNSISSNRYSLIIFNADLLPLHKTTFVSYKPVNYYLESTAILQEVYDSLNHIYEENQAGNSPGLIAGYLYIAVTRILALLSLEKKSKSPDSSMIERVLSYILENYQNQISLHFIAEQLGISPFYLSRVFSNHMGIRLDSYINQLRVNYSCYQLGSTHRHVTEIALESGFDTLRTFNRAFKSITGLTPREYRKQLNR